MDGIAAMEADFQKPVLTSNQVSLWYTLQKLGIHESNAPGSLFRLLYAVNDVFLPANRT